MPQGMVGVGAFVGLGDPTEMDSMAPLRLHTSLSHSLFLSLALPFLISLSLSPPLPRSHSFVSPLSLAPSLLLSPLSLPLFPLSVPRPSSLSFPLFPSLSLTPLPPLCSSPSPLSPPLSVFFAAFSFRCSKFHAAARKAAMQQQSLACCMQHVCNLLPTKINATATYTYICCSILINKLLSKKKSRAAKLVSCSKKQKQKKQGVEKITFTGILQNGICRNILQNVSSEVKNNQRRAIQVPCNLFFTWHYKATIHFLGFEGPNLKVPK